MTKQISARRRRWEENGITKLPSGKYIRFSHSYQMTSMTVYTGTPGNLKAIKHVCRVYK
jgi:hypothetical protein